jgi:opacity protein-like surface antigen
MTRRLTIGAAMLLLTFAVTTPAHADGYISPLIGFNFGGDANCPTVNGCDDKRLNFGVGLGAMNAVLGFEEEFAYARDFFGTAPGLKSSVFTLMSNVMVAPKVGPVRPFFLAGLGLIKTHVDFTTTTLLSTDNNNFGWDVGGGVMITVVPHVAVRGDVRYFHSFQDLGVLGFTVGDTKLNFGRAAGALVFTF